MLWASNAWQHLVRTAVIGFAGLIIFGGAVTPVVVTTVSQRSAKAAAKTVKTTPSRVVSAPKPAVQAPAPAAAAPNPAPAISQPAATTQTKPFPASAPSPGSGAKTLVAVTPDTTPSTPPSSPTTNPSTPNTPGDNTPPSTPAPSDPVLPPATGGYTSTNWAGYVALAGGYKSVSGSWKAPAVTGNGTSTTADSTWIGIGGVFTNDLIQTGTENIVSAGGVVSPGAFYELLPDAAILIPSINVTAGDSMTATITETADNIWQISISDVTAGQSFSIIVNYVSGHSSAEWIEEDPSYLNGSLVPFDNFGTAVFTNGTATRNGINGNILANNGHPITLVDNFNHAIATPSVLNASGNGFNVTHN